MSIVDVVKKIFSKAEVNLINGVQYKGYWLEDLHTSVPPGYIPCAYARHIHGMRGVYDCMYTTGPCDKKYPLVNGAFCQKLLEDLGHFRKIPSTKK